MRLEFHGDEANGNAVGPEADVAVPAHVAVPADALVHDRLVGFFGRASAASRMR